MVFSYDDITMPKCDDRIGITTTSSTHRNCWLVRSGGVVLSNCSSVVTRLTIDAGRPKGGVSVADKTIQMVNQQTCVRVSVCAKVYVCESVCLSVLVSVSMCVHKSVCKWMCLSVCIRVCVRMCVYVSFNSQSIVTNWWTRHYITLTRHIEWRCA